jgi:hypothetical protein
MGSYGRQSSPGACLRPKAQRRAGSGMHTYVRSRQGMDERDVREDVA